MVFIILPGIADMIKTINETSVIVEIPTDAEFCVKVLGVDSAGRSGYPSELRCLHSE